METTEATPVAMKTTEATPVAMETTEATPVEEVTIEESLQDLSKVDIEIKSLDITNKVLIVGISLFSLTILSLLLVTILLLKEVRWRRRHLKLESIVFPDAHLDVLEDLKSAWENLYHEITNYSNRSLSFQKENESLSIKTIDSISQFNTTIDNQKSEIERLKNGYDFAIKKHSIKALIEMDELLRKFLSEDVSDQTKEKLLKVDDYLKSNLEDLDIEVFRFESGLSIRELSPNEFEIVEAVITLDETLHEKVSETVSSGFAFIHVNGKNIVKKAKVKVYKKELEDG